jgi:nucleoside-diphosphate kinase
MIEKTLVLLKPDTIQKNISGKIIDRFESSGLKIRSMKMLQADDKLAFAHYPLDEEWALGLFNKTKASYDKIGKKLEHEGHIEMGKTIQSRLVSFLKEGPIVAMVLEGDDAIQKVRGLAGATEPCAASPGTIRKDFASDESYALADKEKRSVHNLIHASDSLENAQREISVWFSQEEIH